MNFSKKTGVILAVLISAVSYTTTACVSEPDSEQVRSQANLVEYKESGSEQLLAQANPVENGTVVTGEILGIENERVRLQLAEGETEILIPRSEIERLSLLPERLITAALDPSGRATEVRLGEVVYPISTNTPQTAGVVAPVNPEPTIAQAQLPAVVAPVNPEPTPIAQAQPLAPVAPVNPEPAPIAQAQPLAEPPTFVRAFW